MMYACLYRLGFVVFHRKINHTPNATANPGQGFFILNAPMNPKVAITQVTRNQKNVLIAKSNLSVINKKKVTRGKSPCNRSLFF